MDTATIVAIVVVAAVAVVALAALWWFGQKRRSERLRGSYGIEYDRTMQEYGDRRRAEADLEKRRERIERLHIKPLTHDETARFADEWRKVQANFVDDPRAALKEADALVGKVMEKRGYPVGDFEQRAADVSVDHPNVVTNYRTAHRISKESEKGDGTTEEMRQAMQHYRALFDDLLQTAEARR